MFLAMPRVNFNALEREVAYIAKMEELGLEPTIIGVDPLNTEGHFEAHGLAVLDRYFSKGDFINSSILCANDRVAIGALRAAAHHGLEPGSLRRGGLRIAGHDDYPLSQFMIPTLTTVAQNVEAIGQAAVDRLIEKLRVEKFQANQTVQLMDGVLKVRDSA